MDAACVHTRNDEGQDLIEYSLLLGFVALLVVALFAGSGRSIQGLWSTANSTMVMADGAASAPPPASPPATHGDGGGHHGDGGGDGGDGGGDGGH